MATGQKATSADVGRLVRFWTEQGWKFGTLLCFAGPAATIEHPVKGKTIVPMDDVEHYEETRRVQ